MKIAVAQISCALGEPESNLAKIHAFSSRAKTAGAELVVFPEMADTGYSMPVIKKHAATWSEGAVPALQKIARTVSIAILCGVSERDGSRIYNSQVFIDSLGKIAAKYRKTHLFSVPPIAENECFSPGTALVTFETGPLRLGLSICYDLRFPEVYRQLAMRDKANVLVVSSAWPFPRVEHFRTLAVARAIENQSYVVVSNRVGTDDGVSFCGTSAIIDPYGVVIAAASQHREELIVGELCAELIAAIRAGMPVFTDRRADLYG
jgi:omega-amidase